MDLNRLLADAATESRHRQSAFVQQTEFYDRLRESIVATMESRKHRRHHL